MWRLPSSLILFFTAMTASAQPCFDQMGRTAGNCPIRPTNFTALQRDGEPLMLDEKGAVVIKAIVTKERKKGAGTNIGIAGVDGREIVSPRFDRVYAVSRNLAVGEMRTDPKGGKASTRAFLIDLQSGEFRPTPWLHILPTESYEADGPPYLLGVLPGPDTRPYSVAILSATGADTGLRADGIDPYLMTERISTISYNFLKVKGDIIDASGADPFAGRKMHDLGSNYGFFVEKGPPPSEVKGPGVGPLLIPLSNSGEPQALPADVIGMVKGSVWMWTIRRTPKGPRFYQHEWGRPMLGAAPVGEGYLDLYIDEVVAVRTSKGWIDPFIREIYPTAEGVVTARKAELKAFAAAVLAEDRTNNPQYYPKSAAEIAAEKAAGEAARQAYLEGLRGRMRDAKAGKIGGIQLSLLQREVASAQLEGEYQTMGMPLNEELKREICWQRQSTICNRSASPSGSSSSGFVSTWEKAFENSRALSQRQYQENCAAASKGASRICRTY